METGIYQDQLPRLFTVYKIPIVHLVWEDALVIYGMLKLEFSETTRKILDRQPCCVLSCHPQLNFISQHLVSA